jgi:uncharacterized protein
MSDAADPPPLSGLSRILDGIGRFLVRRRIPLLIAAAVISLFAAIPASRLELDESLESFFSSSDPLLQAYTESREAFGGDEFVLVAFEQENPTYADALDEVTRFSDELSSVPGVRRESTQDLARTLRVIAGPVLDVLPRPAKILARRMIRDRLIEFSRRLLIGDNRNVSAVILRLAPEEQSAAERATTFREIRRIAAAHNPPAFVAGEPVQVHDMFRYVERDSRVLGIASTALMTLVILAMFRSLRWVLLPLVIVHATLLWTKAILYFSGLKLSMVSSMLTSLLTIIGIATVTHITVLYRDYRTALDREGAFRRVFADAAAPVFWVTVTTVVGFAALLCSEITPIRSFSWMMSIGTTLLLVTFPMILPGGVLVGNFQAEPKPTGFERRVESWLDRTTAWVERHSLLVLVVTASLSIITAIGCLRQRVETDFSKNFRERSPIVQSIRFFESRLGGVGSWEVNFEAPAELTTEFLDKIRDLTSRLAEIHRQDGTELTKIVAITDGLDLIPPIVAEDWVIKRDWLAKLQPEFEPSLYNPSKHRMRIVLRALEQQPAEQKLELIRRVEETSREVFPDAKATGLYVLLANLITSVLGDQVTSAWIATLGILVCVFCAFRDWRIALISLAPNILPILFVVGGIGWADTPVNIGAAMVASVSLGLTVDASILYLTDYQRARLRGASHADAIHETHAGAGLAVVLASLALMSGFAVLTLSEFIPLVFFGALVSVAMAVGLLGNVVLLPIMLGWLPEIPAQRERRNSQTSAAQEVAEERSP